MVGLFGLQQGILHGSVAEKVQQAKSENSAVFQQLAAAEIKEKQLLQKRVTTEAGKTDDVRIRGDKKKEHREKRQKRKHAHSTSTPADVSQEQKDHILDIIA